MYIITDPLHSMREFFRIRNEITVRITLFQAPAVIDDQIFVSGLQISVFYHAICHLTDHFFIDIPGKGIPGIPAHRRVSAIGLFILLSILSYTPLSLLSFIPSFADMIYFCEISAVRDAFSESLMSLSYLLS